MCGEMDRDLARLWGRLGLAVAISSFSRGRVFLCLREMEADIRGVVRIFFWEFVNDQYTQTSSYTAPCRTSPTGPDPVCRRLSIVQLVSAFPCPFSGLQRDILTSKLSERENGLRK